MTLRDEADYKGEQLTLYSFRHRYAKGMHAANVSIATGLGWAEVTTNRWLLVSPPSAAEITTTSGRTSCRLESCALVPPSRLSKLLTVHQLPRKKVGTPVASMLKTIGELLKPKPNALSALRDWFRSSATGTPI